MGRRRHALAHPHLLIHEVKILCSGLLAVRILRRGDRLQVITLLLLTPLTRSSQGVASLGAISQLRLQRLNLRVVRHASLLVRSFRGRYRPVQEVLLDHIG